VRKPLMAFLWFPVALLGACGGPAVQPEETADLQLTFSENLPAEVQRAYLVVHHQDGSPDRWFDLVALAGSEQPLPHVAKYGYFTVLTEVERDLSSPRSGRYRLRHAASFPSEIFLSLDKGLRIDPDGRVYLVFSGASNPWRSFELAGACPDAADLVSNRSFGAVDTGSRPCTNGAVDPGPLRARVQADGALSSFVWAVVANANGGVPTDPPRYAPVEDAAPNTSYALTAADWRSDAEVWRFDVDGAPAGGRLLAAFAALRGGAEVAGFHAFTAGCPDAGAACLLAVVPGARSGLEGYRLNARLDGGTGGSFWLAQAWKPISGATGSYVWTYTGDLPRPYANVGWTGAPPVVEFGGGTAAVREAADAWGYDLSASPYLRREWWVFGRDPGEPIVYPTLPPVLAGFAPDPADDVTGVYISGFDFDPLAAASAPEAGRYWVRAQQSQALSAASEAAHADLRGPEGWTRVGGGHLDLR